MTQELQCHDATQPSSIHMNVVKYTPDNKYLVVFFIQSTLQQYLHVVDIATNRVIRNVKLTSTEVMDRHPIKRSRYRYHTTRVYNNPVIFNKGRMFVGLNNNTRSVIPIDLYKLRHPDKAIFWAFILLRAFQFKLPNCIPRRIFSYLKYLAIVRDPS